MLNKGAMFGLDARIALAIFGALSVISGAALYSAIQDSKVTQIITQMNEIGKAYEQYVLDTGSEMAIVGAGNYDRDIDRLLTNNSITGWNGPYISIEDVGFGGSNIEGRINTSNGKKLFIRCLIKDSTIGGASTTSKSPKCVSGNANSVNWILYEPFSIEIAEAIDKRIDGAVNHNDGKVRLVSWPSGDTSIYFEYMHAMDF